MDTEATRINHLREAAEAAKQRVAVAKAQEEALAEQIRAFSEEIRSEGVDPANLDLLIAETQATLLEKMDQLGALLGS